MAAALRTAAALPDERILVELSAARDGGAGALSAALRVLREELQGGAFELTLRIAGREGEEMVGDGVVLAAGKALTRRHANALSDGLVTQLAAIHALCLHMAPTATERMVARARRKGGES